MPNDCRGHAENAMERRARLADRQHRHTHCGRRRAAVTEGNDAAACDYQSSFTTRTASSLIASRAATSVVTTASASNAVEKTARPDQGTDRSMLQWNDCRFTT